MNERFGIVSAIKKIADSIYLHHLFFASFLSQHDTLKGLHLSLSCNLLL